MTIAELKAATQQHNLSSGQAYIQVDGVLYPIADVDIQPDGLIIVAAEAVTEGEESEAPDAPEDDFSLSTAIDEAVTAGEISDEEAQGLLEF